MNKKLFLINFFVIIFILSIVYAYVGRTHNVAQSEKMTFSNIRAEIDMVNGNKDTIGICKNFGDIQSYTIPEIKKYSTDTYLVFEPEQGKSKKITVVDGYQVLNLTLIYTCNNGKIEVVSRW
jgi:hypothetical protein